MKLEFWEVCRIYMRPLHCVRRETVQWGCSTLELQQIPELIALKHACFIDVLD